MINEWSKILKIDNKSITNYIIWLNRKNNFQNIINRLSTPIQRIFKKQFKSSKKRRTKKTS